MGRKQKSKTKGVKRRNFIQKECETLSALKDKFIRFWPNLGYVLIDLNSKYQCGVRRTLVVGSGRIPRIHGEKVLNTDIRPFSGVSVLSDAQILSFKENTFDIVFCRQVLEHLPDADKAAMEMFRVLKPGGKVIVTVPFFYPFHASPYDFRRWTILGLSTTFRQFQEVESGIYVGPVAGMLTAIQHFAGVLVPNYYASYVVKALLGYLLIPFKYIDVVVSRFPQAANVASSVYFVGEKRHIEE